MITLAAVQQFLEPKKMAIAGVSRDPKKFGRMVYNHLKERGFILFAINPFTDRINGDPCYRSIADLPSAVEHLYIVTPKNETLAVLQSAIDKGIRNIWIQQSSETDEVLDLARENNINLICKKCMFMFAEPVTGVHKFHRFFSRLFSSYPR